MDDVMNLIKEQKTQDANGVWRSELIVRQVYCHIESVTRAEFYDAGRNGLVPQFRFVIFAGDYDGESICAYKNQSYSVYRTYHVPGTDYLELYVERKGGTNGKQTQSNT